VGTVPGMTRSSGQMVALSAGEAVLGLLIEQGANSYQLERRLEERFGSAQFAHGTAYHAVKRLSKQGLIRAVEEDESPLPARAEVGGLRATAYEATAEGVEHFERWLTASISTPPVREELLAKVAFCGPADLPRMIEIVREAELACMTQLENLNDRMRRERRLLGDDEWRRLMGMIVTAGDVAWWDARIKWLQELRQHLQREGQDYEARRRSASKLPGA
jgi:DNA-binding PadR family transcriptional regulator